MGNNGERYYFRTGGEEATGDSIIPVADGAFYTRGMKESLDESEVYFEFFSDAEATTPVTPTAGTIDVAGRPGDHNYLAASSNATIQATAVSTPTATYTPAVMDGCVNKGRITLAGITGAEYMKAWVFKHV